MTIVAFDVIEKLRHRAHGRHLQPSPPTGAYEIELTDAGIWHLLVKQDQTLKMVDGASDHPLCRLTCRTQDLARMLTGSAVDIIYSFVYNSISFSHVRYAPFYQLLLEREEDASRRRESLVAAGGVDARPYLRRA